MISTSIFMPNISEGPNIVIQFALRPTFSLSQHFLEGIVDGKFSIVHNRHRNVWYKRLSTHSWLKRPSNLQCKSMCRRDHFLLILGKLEELKNISNILNFQSSYTIANLLSSSEKFWYSLILWLFFNFHKSTTFVFFIWLSV